MTSKNISTKVGNAPMTTVDQLDLMQSPPMSCFIQRSQRHIVAKCTPIQSTGSDVTRYNPTTGKCQVVIVQI